MVKEKLNEKAKGRGLCSLKINSEPFCVYDEW